MVCNLQAIEFVLIGFIMVIYTSPSNADYTDNRRNISKDNRQHLPAIYPGYSRSISVAYLQRTLTKILTDASLLVHTPSLTVYTKAGGYKEALRDFGAVKPTAIYDLGNGWKEGWIGTRVKVTLEKERQFSGFSILRIDDNTKSYMIHYRQLQ